MTSRHGALFALTVLLFVQLGVPYRDVFLRGHVISSAALAYGMAPWRGHTPGLDPPLRGNPVLSDDLTLFTPWDAATRTALRSGAFPLWNPESGCGMPLLANNQSAILAPTQGLRFLWDSPRARTVGMLLKVVVAGLGMFLLLRRWRLDDASAMLGALSWSGSAAITVWLLYPLAETAAWLAWVLLGISELLGIGGPPRRRGAVTLALSGGALLLSGHLPTALQFVAAIAGGVLVLVAWRPAFRQRVPALATAALASLMLAAPQILPTAGYIAGSQAVRDRAAGATVASASLPAQAAWSWLVPRGFGSPEIDGYRGELNFNEATAWVGIAPLLPALLLLIFARDRRIWALAGMAAVATALAHGVPPLSLVLAHTPVLKWAAGQRWIVIAQFGVAALGAIGASRLQEFPRRRLVLAAATVGAVLLAVISLHPGVRGGGETASMLASRWVSFAALEALMAAGACMLAAFRPALARAALVTLALVTSIAFAWGFNPTIPPAALPGPTEESRLLAELGVGGRVLPLGWVLRPNTGVLAGVRTVTGIDDLVPRRHAEFRNSVGFDALDSGLPLAEGSIELLRRAATTLVVASRPISQQELHPVAEMSGPTLWAARLDSPHPLAGWYPAARPVADARSAFSLLSTRGAVAENTVLVEGLTGWSGSPGGAPVALPFVRSGPNVVTVRSDRPQVGIVVIREATDPGWHVTIDGRRATALVVDGMFTGAKVPPGVHTVEFRYRPFGWELSLVLAGMASIGTAAFAVSARRRRGASDVSSTHGPSPENHDGSGPRRLRAQGKAG